MTTENLRLRSEFINTQVITRNSGKKLGVVKEILVDIDRREVVALGLRDNALSLSGLPQYMYLSSVTQTGDVILVEDEDVFEPIDIDAYSPLVRSEVITETGEPLGKVRDFQFSIEDGKVSSIIIASIGLPQIPEQFLSTYELSMEEVVSSGPNRLIVFEGSEERLTQITVGLLERLGIGRPPWEREEEEVYYPPTARPENQLGSGIPLRTPLETVKPVVRQEQRWEEEENWQEARPGQKAEALRYEEEYEYEAELEEDNWGGNRDEEYEEDAWDEETEANYNPPRVNIPEKRAERVPEYEEEGRGY
jgi:sporulation protein YlmC with PRC-barrel domain